MLKLLCSSNVFSSCLKSAICGCCHSSSSSSCCDRLQHHHHHQQQNINTGFRAISHSYLYYLLAESPSPATPCRPHACTYRNRGDSWCSYNRKYLQVMNASRKSDICCNVLIKHFYDSRSFFLSLCYCVCVCVSVCVCVCMCACVRTCVR